MIRNIVFILLFSILVFASYQSSYPSRTPDNLMYKGFWMTPALKHLKKISAEAHPTGTTSNRNVRRHLVKELNKLGADVSIQKTTSYNSKIRKAAPINNIIAIFPGKNSQQENRKKLLLLSHYDSAKVYSKGAADAGSGVVVILESMRGFLKANKSFENDIVVVFTDGEELGLLGAHAFVEQHHLADSIGLVLNFEARGSSGPVIMWPESTSGTAAMISLYEQAEAEFPVTSSLIYEVYKLLPNDTDLTVFKNLKGINGMNFAFIDNHYNYHTVNDDLNHISYNSLMHQGLQLSALLPLVANTNLNTQVQDTQDSVYFTIPMLGMVNWPAVASTLIIVTAWFLFILTVFIGIKSGRVNNKKIIKSTFSWLLSCLLSVLLTVFLIHALYQWLEPQHHDILQGYPYLGYGYLLSFLLAALISPFIVYGNRHKTLDINTALPASTAWLMAFSILSLKLPGASYLLLPVISAYLMMLVILFHEKTGLSLSIIFAVFGLLIVSLLLTLLPVALGLKSSWIAVLLLTWCLTMFAPMIASHSKKYSWFLLLIPVAFFVWINSKDMISHETPLPTSLSYLYDVDDQQGWFYSFDHNEHEWNNKYFEKEIDEQAKNQFIGKHKQVAHKIGVAETNIALKAANMSIIEDKLNINPSKKTIVYEGFAQTSLVQIYSLKEITIEKLSINGRYIFNKKPQLIPEGSRLIEYHLDGQKQLKIEITLAEGNEFDWQVISHQFDLLRNPNLDVKKRPESQIPKPFIFTDNTVVSQRFQIQATLPAKNINHIESN